MSTHASDSGPLADRDIVTGGPIDDPTLGGRADPRWSDPSFPTPDAQPLTNPDGSPDVMPPRSALDERLPDIGDGLDEGTRQDPAARPLDGELETGRDNIRDGRGDSVANPALAEGGDNG